MTNVVNDEIEELKKELENHNIFATSKFIFKGEVCLELYNKKGKSSFNTDQKNIILKKGGKWVNNMDLWVLPLKPC